MEVIKNKLNIEDFIHIDWCNRMGKGKDNCPRTMTFKLNKFKDKQKILRNVTLEYTFMMTFAMTK